MRSLLVLAVIATSVCSPSGNDSTLEILGSSVEGAREIVHARGNAVDPEVVALLYGPQQLPFCTGTLIAPTVVVTAAHCFDEHPDALHVFFGDDARPGSREGRSIAVTDVAVHPGWDPRVEQGDDIALVRLAEDPGIAPKPMIPPGATDALGGQLMRIVGFGFSDAAETQFGVKLEGIARVTAVGATTLTHVPAPSATCPGDSGGPGFVLIDGSEFLAAVHNTGSCGGESTKTRVDAYRDSFIDPFVRNAPPAPAVAVAAQERPAPAPTPALTVVSDTLPAVPDPLGETDPESVYLHSFWYFETRDYATACPGLRRYLEIAPDGRWATIVRDRLLSSCR